MKASIKGFRQDSDVSELLKTLVDSLGESITNVCNECIRLGGPLLIEKHRRDQAALKATLEKMKRQAARN